MKSQIIIFLTLSTAFWACQKKQEGCDSTIKVAIVTDSSVIAGDSLNLKVTGIDKNEVYIYNWYGPGGFYSHDSAPSIPNTTAANAGRYSVDVITNGGCIYSATTDSILIGAPTIPCALTNDEADISSEGSFYFTYISAAPDGGTYAINASGAEGDATITFYGSNPPGSGIYTIPTDPTNMVPGNVQVVINDGFSDWNANPGTVYVAVTNGKISVSACSLKFISDAFGYTSAGSFKITTP
jgi:hypothetical protein